MIKAIAPGKDGRTLLIIGLSFANLDRFRAQPCDTFIRIDGKDTGDLPVDITIFSARTEAEAAHMLDDLIGPETQVHVSDKLKS